MKKVMLNKVNIKLFSLYIVLAGIATIVDVGLLYIFTNYLGIWYFYSAILSYLAGMLTNYSLNKYLNFKNKSKKIAWQFGLFIIVALVGLALNQLILYLLVNFAGLWYIWAKLVAVFVVMFWSFFGHKKLTFKVFQ